MKRIRVGPSTRHDYLSAEGAVSRHTLSATLRLAHFELCQAIGTFLLVCVYLGATRQKPPYVIRQHYWQQLKQRHSELSTPLQIYCFGERLIVCCVGIANNTEDYGIRRTSTCTGILRQGHWGAGRVSALSYQPRCIHISSHPLILE